MMRRPASQRLVWLGTVLVAGLVLSVYLSLLPSHLSSANSGTDGGDLLAAVLTAGVPHPTGYPTYVLLGRLFQDIPLGNPLWRGALLSAIPAALASALLGAWLWQSQTVTPSIADNPARPALLPALVAGAAWGISPLLLSQAVIVEVHGLQALCVLLALVWTWLLLQSPSAWGKGYSLVILAFLYGLGLGNHLTLLLFIPALGAAAGTALRKGLPVRWGLAQLGALLLGTLVYLYLPLSARQYPSMNWGNPQTWEGFLWVVSGGPYRELWLGAPAATLADRLLTWFSWLRQQYGLPGLALGAAGALLCSQSDRRLMRLLGWVFVSYSLLAILFHTADSIVYLIPAALVWAVWIAFALWYTWDARWRGMLWGRWLCFGFCISLLVRFPSVYRQVDPRTDRRLDEFAQSVLRTAPQSALVLTQSDPDTFSLWYTHFGLKERPDMAVVSVPLTGYPWYRETLSHTYPDLALPRGVPKGDPGWAELLARRNPQRPVCRTGLTSEQPISFTFECQSSSP